MFHALTKAEKAISVDTDSETEAAAPGHVKMTAVKQPPAAPPASLQPPPVQTESEADMWKRKYEELKSMLWEAKQEEAPPVTPVTPASPPAAKPLFSPTPTATAPAPTATAPAPTSTAIAPAPTPTATAPAPTPKAIAPAPAPATTETPEKPQPSETSEDELKRLAAVDLSREELSSHALYMRLRRLCTPTGTGKLQVSKEIADQWAQGNRDELQLALVMALKQHGFEDSNAVRKQVRVGKGCPKRFFNVNYVAIIHTK